jgi:hypothetical protein
MRALAFLLFLSLGAGAALPFPVHAQVTALTEDCKAAGPQPLGGFQFIEGCALRARAPDGRHAIGQARAKGESGAISLTENGKPVDTIPALDDGMPFVLFWSPRSAWFFANHYLGSGLDRLRVFELVNHAVVERSNLMAAATRAMVARYPCLRRHATVVASGWRWSRDGRRIVLVAYARPDACYVEGRRNQARWEPLWMIGDPATGRIDPASLRVRKNGIGAMPKDGPYAKL